MVAEINGSVESTAPWLWPPTQVEVTLARVALIEPPFVPPARLAVIDGSVALILPEGGAARSAKSAEILGS